MSVPTRLVAEQAPAPALTAELHDADRLPALAPALRAAADAHDTPLYVTDLPTLDRCAAEIESAFPGPWLRRYSLKANGLPALVRRLARRGWGGNVVSAGEWRLARRAGLPNAEISFEGIGKTDRELEAVVRAALDGQPLRWLCVESADEVRALSRLGRDLGAGRRGRPPVGILVRLNPQVEPETTAGLAVGRMTSKFGLTAAEVRQLRLAGAFDDPGICLRGVHVHVGSQLAGVQAWTGGARAALGVWAELRERYGDQVDTVDFGGGFPSGLAAAPSPAGFRLALDDLIATQKLAVPARVAIEPGRSVVAASGWILARVLHVRSRGHRQQVVIDAGMTELIRPSLYGARHCVYAVSGRRAPGDLLDTAVEGPVCESSDTFGVHRLPVLRRGISSPSPARAPTHRPRAAGTTAVPVRPSCSSMPTAISNSPALVSRCAGGASAGPEPVRGGHRDNRTLGNRRTHQRCSHG
jgi:diaminopimelate decarboxylase